MKAETRQEAKELCYFCKHSDFYTKKKPDVCHECRIREYDNGIPSVSLYEHYWYRTNFEIDPIYC